MELKKRFLRAFALVLGGVLALGVVAAFRFVSQPIQSTVTSDPPNGNLWVNGTFAAHFTINQSSVSVFWVTNKINAPVTFSMNFTISGVNDLYTVDPTIAGSPPNLVLIAPNLYATSGTYTLQSGQKIEIDVGATFHKLGTFTLTLRAVGDA